MRAPLYKYQRRFLQVLIITSILSVVNSILVFKFELYGGEDHGFAIGFTFIVFTVVLISFSIFWHAHFVPYNKWLGTDSEYVKENYPDIWKRVAPHLQALRNPLFFFRFIRGHYDDGTDERLNRIKQEMKDNQNLIAGGFLLLVGTELFNVILHGLSQAPTL